MAGQTDILATVLAEVQAMRAEGRETQRDVRQLMIDVAPLPARLTHIEDDVKANGTEIGSLQAWRWRAAGAIALGGVFVGWPLQALAADVLSR